MSKKEVDEILKKIHVSAVAKLTKCMVVSSPIDLNSVVMDLFSTVKSETYKLNYDKAPIVVAFDMGVHGTGDYALNQGYLANFFSSGSYAISNTIFVGSDGRCIQPNPYFDGRKKLLNLGEITDDSEDNGDKFLYVFIIRNEVQFSYKGKIIHDIPEISSYDRKGEIRGRFNVADYRTIVNAHHTSELVGERGMKYWAKKSEWKLIASPEVHFRKRLMSFIEQNTSGAKVDEECMSNGDRTDIRIIELASGQIYIIEVKWMGKSAGSNILDKLAHDKANEGISQLDTYLKQEANSVVGLLVMYDARQDRFEIIWNPKKEAWDLRIDREPILPVLDPISASAKAKKAVKKKKKR